MFTIKRTEELNQTYDLHKLPIGQWPEEAKEIGRRIVANPIRKVKMDQQSPGLRKAWLIAQIEKEQAFKIEDL